MAHFSFRLACSPCGDDSLRHVLPVLAPTRFPLFYFLDERGMLLSVVELLEGASLMEWVTPQHEEIDLNCEISSYANAEL